MRFFALAWMVAVGAGCHSAVRSDLPQAPPPAPAPTIQVSSDEELATGRARFDALAPQDPARGGVRAGIERYAAAQVAKQCEAGQLDAAWELFKKTLTLWEPEDLKRPPEDRVLIEAAHRIEHSFARRGGHEQALTALAVQIDLGRDPAAQVRWREVLDLVGAAPQDTHDVPPIVNDLESLSQVWPSPRVAAELERVLTSRAHQPHRALEGFSGLAQLVAPDTLGFDVARIHLRAGEPAAALAALDRVAGEPGDAPKVRAALRRYLGREGKAADAIELAHAFERDRQVAGRICRDAASRFPRAVEPELCLGEIAEEREQVATAFAAYQRAVEIDPKRRETWEHLALLHQQRLAQLVADEKVGELPRELTRVEEFQARAKSALGEPLKTNLSGALFEVGRGFYNAGQVDRADSYLKRSIDVEPTPWALDQLATLELKRGRGPESAALFQRALDVLESSRLSEERKAYWRSKIETGKGDAAELAGDGRSAERAREQAVVHLDPLVKAQPHTDEQAEAVAEAMVEMGKLFYLLGERERAITMFQIAIDRAPDRQNTYADEIAFLVPRGEIDDAVDTYHRALGRAEVNEYLKVYCSLWLLDLEKRAGRTEDEGGRAFLGGVDGEKWYQHLARWATGRETAEQLEAAAKEPPQRAELYFYRAMRALQGGDVDGARALWRKVLDTQMMAFFEFDMATYYLRHGARTTPTAATPKTKGPKPPARIPDGSI